MNSQPLWSTTQVVNQFEMSSTGNNNESCKLLDFSQSDSLSEPDVQPSFAKRKVRFKRKPRSASARTAASRRYHASPHHPSAMFADPHSGVCQCWRCVKLLSVLLLVVIFIVQLWFVLNLRTRVDSLYALYKNNVDGENRHLPETLHTIHSKLKQLEMNITSLVTDLGKTSNLISELRRDVNDLKVTSDRIKESVAAAPQIKDLPNSVSDLKNNVATLGSRVVNVESSVKDLKGQTDTLGAVKAEIDELRSSMKTLAVNASNANTHLQTKDISEQLLLVKDRLNTTSVLLSNSLQSFNVFKNDLSDVRTVLCGQRMNASSSIGQFKQCFEKNLFNTVSSWKLNDSFGGTSTWLKTITGSQNLLDLFFALEKMLKLPQHSGEMNATDEIMAILSAMQHMGVTHFTEAPPTDSTPSMIATPSFAARQLLPSHQPVRRGVLINTSPKAVDATNVFEKALLSKVPKR